MTANKPDVLNDFGLRSGDLVLRDWQPDDLKTYLYWAGSGHAWQSLNGPYHRRPNHAEVHGRAAVVRSKLARDDWPPVRQELVISQTDGEMLGIVSRYWLSEQTNWLAAGIAIYDSNYWGYGVGFIAMGLWTDYLFRSELGLARLDLRTWSGNEGMMRLAEKLGFREEARFRKARIVRGRYYDEVGYGVLREEWDERYPGGFVPLRVV